MLDRLKNTKERLSKVVYFEPHVERGGRNLDGLQVLLDDAKWLASQLESALAEIERLTTDKGAA